MDSSETKESNGTPVEMPKNSFEFVTDVGVVYSFTPGKDGVWGVKQAVQKGGRRLYFDFCHIRAEGKRLLLTPLYRSGEEMGPPVYTGMGSIKSGVSEKKD